MRFAMGIVQACYMNWPQFIHLERKCNNVQKSGFLTTLTVVVFEILHSNPSYNPSTSIKRCLKSANRSITLQNPLALAKLLLKEQGVCRMLNLTHGECCLTYVHNATSSTEEARKNMKEVSEQTGDLFQAMQPKDCFNGWSPGSWFTSLLNPANSSPTAQSIPQIRISPI